MILENTLKEIKIRTLVFISVFIAISVALPMLLHLAVGPAAGKLFLPMQLFVFVAALLLGWRVGIVTGILSALISFSITGMPAVEILPIITIELALYGLLTGYFYNKTKNIYLSLIGAMILGRIILLGVIYILPIKISAISYVFSAAYAGAIGIAIQLVLIPLIYTSLKKYISDERI